MTMKKTFLSFALFTLLAGGVSAQVANVNPRPQTVNSTGKLFTAPVDACGGCIEVFELKFAEFAAVHGVSPFTAEAFDVE